MHGHWARTDRCDTCRDWPDWAIELLIRIDQLEITVSTDFTALNSAVAVLQTTESNAIAALSDLSAKLASVGNVEDQATVDAITAQLTGMSSSLSAAVSTDDPVPADVDPVATEPTPIETPPPTTSPASTFYQHVGDDAFDATVWPDSGLKDAAGNELYTFASESAPGTSSDGASAEWAVSTPA